MRRRTTLAAAALAAVLFGAGDAPPAGPKSAAAVAAIRKGDAAVDAAAKVYAAAVSKARTTEAAELKAAGRVATSKGDADEIVAIAAKGKDVEGSAAEASATGVGQWDFMDASGGHVSWTVTTERAGHTRTADVGRPEFGRNVVVVHWPSGWVDRLTIFGSRAFWESYPPGSSPDAPPSTVMAGRLVPPSR